MGRSRGGLTTKIHALVDADGLPVRLELSAGQAADAFEEACAKLKVIRRTTKPYTPQTNGMVERFNSRVASEVLGINVAGHADLETLLVGFNHAYNRRRQRVLNGHTPCQIVEEHIMASAKLANPHYRPTKQEDIMDKVDNIIFYANEVSQPDS